MTSWTAAQIPDQSGRRAVVTGANSGLGLVTATELARKGATVILAVRTLEKGEQAAAQIRKEVPTADVEVRELDLSSLDSVRAFAATITDADAPLDLLVNNAGIMMTPAQKTADGFELQFGTNHLGHFALTGLLLDALAAGTDPRVVTVSSIEHKPGHVHFDDLQLEHGYAPRKAYQQSKMANAVFGLELDRRLRAADSPVKSLLAHPGYSNTNLQSTGPTGIAKLAMWFGNRVIAQGADKGALPQLHAATAPGVEGGQFFGPDGFQEFRGAVTEVRAVREARDEQIGRRLWNVSEELTGVQYGLAAATA